MALEGSLKDFGLADIFQLIYLQKKTGTLTMKNSSTEARVLFENGLVVKAETSNLEGLDKIGEILARSGKITEDQLKEALMNQRISKEKVGVILVEMGALQKEDLIKALGLHVREAVFSLFQWKEGRYSFESSEISVQRDYWPPVNTEFLIMEGVRRIDEWPFIEKRIPNLEMIFEKNKESENKVKVAQSEEDSLDDMFGETKKEEGIQITREEMVIYSLVDGQQNVRRLSEISNMGEFETCKALSNLLTAGMIAQITMSEPASVGSEKAGTMKEGAIRLTGRQMLSGLVVALCLSLMAMYGGRSVESLRQTGEISRLYKSILWPNRLQQIGYSILTFYYREQRLPESLKDLIQESHHPPGLRQATEDGEILYEPQSGSSTFILRLNERQ